MAKSMIRGNAKGYLFFIRKVLEELELSDLPKDIPSRFRRVIE
jgi:hypothetical protein